MRGPCLSRDQVRELDRLAIQEVGIPGLILMENAGRACAGAALEMLGGGARKAVCVCGRGNNGGDGFVIARHLANARVDVAILVAAPLEELLSGAGDAATNLEIVLNMGLRVEAINPDGVALRRALDSARLVVDALLGTGIAGDVREPIRSWIETINQSGRPVLAVDIPSGLDCDEGVPLGVAVRAGRTVTFVLAKKGFRASGAADYTGEVDVAEISIPRMLIEQKLVEWGVTPGI